MFAINFIEYILRFSHFVDRIRFGKRLQTFETSFVSENNLRGTLSWLDTSKTYSLHKIMRNTSQGYPIQHRVASFESGDLHTYLVEEPTLGSTHETREESIQNGNSLKKIIQSEILSSARLVHFFYADKRKEGIIFMLDSGVYPNLFMRYEIQERSD